MELADKAREKVQAKVRYGQRLGIPVVTILRYKLHYPDQP